MIDSNFKRTFEEAKCDTKVSKIRKTQPHETSQEICEDLDSYEGDELSEFEDEGDEGEEGEEGEDNSEGEVEAKEEFDDGEITEEQIATLTMPQNTAVSQQPQYCGYYDCYDCDFRCQSIKDLTTHYQTIHGTVCKYYCKTCAKLFPVKAKFQKHNWTHHIGQELRCQYCDFICVLESKLHKHISNEHTPAKCELCSKVFKSSNCRNKHSKNNHGSDATFVCNQCNVRFKRQFCLSTHIKLVHNSCFLCSLCNQTFDVASKLRSHEINDHSMYKHDKNKLKHKCSFCSQIFATKFKLRHHYSETHPQLLTFACTQCSRRFPGKQELEHHVQRIHETPHALYSCSQCPSAFRWQHNLRTHINYKHSNNRLFPCSSCSKTFVTGYDLTRHIQRRHTKELKYSCKQCYKAFKWEQDLQRHVQWMHGPRHLVCEYCPKKYYGVLQLRQHLRKEHKLDIKPYLCSQCTLTFHQKGQLLYHMAKQHQ